MRIYVASSWRNMGQPNVVTALRIAGHEVYDFKNPAPGDTGFHWSEIDPEWKTWSAENYRRGLRHPVAIAGFSKDMSALTRADATVLVLPCGRSAHLELGIARGAGQRTFVLLDDPISEPELMYLACERVCISVQEVIDSLQTDAH